MEKKDFTVQEIAQYIIAHYPKSFVVNNAKDEHGTVHLDLITPDDCLEFFYYTKLNWCGCGMPEQAQKTIRDFLNVQDAGLDWEAKSARIESVLNLPGGCDHPLWLCMAYALDAAGFTEHGGGVYGAWLTEEGYMFLCLLNHIDFDAEQL